MNKERLARILFEEFEKDGWEEINIFYIKMIYDKQYKNAEVEHLNSFRQHDLVEDLEEDLNDFNLILKRVANRIEE